MLLESNNINQVAKRNKVISKMAEKSPIPVEASGCLREIQN